MSNDEKSPEEQFNIGVKIADTAILSVLVSAIAGLDQDKIDQFQRSVHNSLRGAYADTSASQTTIDAIKSRVDAVVSLAKQITG
ncbi:hypothetical protein [Burkholderia vietnamiensis]|uniref:hypothetical protein n=1 Tax=Burkholderia vietnamiensis TaxID=60552 RepID=UPI0012D94D87|nr:hypothetical protein [Burkholderia vietnamiensis]